MHLIKIEVTKTMSKLIILITLAITVITGCNSKNNSYKKPFDYKTLPSMWIELSEKEGKSFICEEADVLVMEGNELTRYYVATGEKDQLEVLESYQTGDTIVLHIKWINQEREEDLQLIWMDKEQGIARWIFEEESNNEGIFVVKEKSSAFPQETCEDHITYNEDENIESLVSDINDFAPTGWKIIDSIYGDLNNDGQKDVVLVTVKSDPKEIVEQPENPSGTDTIYLSPLKLIVAFKEGEHYRLIAQNSHFLPSGDDNLPNPLSEPGGISIEKGVLRISMHYWYSSGSWYVSDDEYIFRFQNNKFELIGFSSSSFHRASGEMTSVSVNYSTQKKQTTTGGNMFEEENNKPQEKWEKINVPTLHNLEEMSPDINLY